MVSTVAEFDVAVVGAGAVGLAAACQLAQQYSRVVVIDQAPFSAWQSGDDYGLIDHHNTRILLRQ